MKGFGTVGIEHIGSPTRTLFHLFIVSKMAVLLIPKYAEDFRSNFLHVCGEKMVPTKLSTKLNNSNDFLQCFVVINFLLLFNPKTGHRHSKVYGAHR
jgi:hypothetical protein